MNQVVLTACIAEANVLRYTPAGLPAFDFRLEHESQVTEAGHIRQVKVAIKAVAFGSLAQTLAKLPQGSTWTFTGFLATPRNGKHPVLHVQQIQD